MKIAIVHDYIKEYGGAERVVEELIKIFPEATVYTTIFMPEYLGPHRKRVEQWKIKTTWLQKVPFKGKFISYARLVAPLVFKNLDLSSYDVVITSAAGTYTSPNFVKIGENTRLICYCHTPPRYLYGYKTANNWDSNPGRKFLKTIGTVPMHFLRLLDFKSAQNVDQFIANSEEVKARIKKFYRRDAEVIYPPVTFDSRFKISNSAKVSLDKQDSRREKYYLTGGRLARAKGIDVIVAAFNKNGLPLKIFGKGFAGFEEELKKMANKNIEFIGEVTDEEKFELMAKAKAFVFASYDEDFGITPVEAMGVGTPVIAFKSGGVKETVIDKETGLFYDENSPEGLNIAIEKFESASWRNKINPEDCVAQAKKFSKEEFDKKIRALVNNA